MYEVRGRIRWLKRSRIPGNELAGHYSVRLAGFFTRPSIAANLSSQSGGNHESPPFLLSFFLGTMHFFPLRLPLLTSFFLRRAHREIRTTSDERFHLILLPPSFHAGPVSLGPSEVLPTRCLSKGEEFAFTRIRILCRPEARRWRRDDTYAENAKGPTTPDSEGPP